MVGVASSLLQTGFVFATQPLTPDLSRLNPLAGLRRLVSLRSLVEMVKAGLKLVVVGWVAFVVLRDRATDMMGLLGGDLRATAAVPFWAVFDLALRVGLIFLALAVFDFVYQRWEQEKRLRMTREELREELKRTEGDPLIRSRIRQRQRALASRRMMAAVPRATVVIINPVHVAVALEYRPEVMAAPRVTAKGQRLIAERIKEIAREYKVPIVENPPLAQALFQAVEIGQAIPGALYQAVAEVLAFIYRLRGRF